MLVSTCVMYVSVVGGCAFQRARVHVDRWARQQVHNFASCMHTRTVRVFVCV